MSTLKQISEMMNVSIVPAIMGEEFTLAPDLSNIIDFGTVISSMTADQFKSYMGDFVAGVAKTTTDTREYSPERIPFYVDSQEYGGMVQSLKIDMFDTQDSNLFSLENGQVYNDVNKYFGTPVSNKVYEKDVTYQIVKSIPEFMYKKAFTTPEGVAALVAYIERTIRNSLNRAESALEHNLLAALAISGKEIKLVTEYNNMVNGVSPADPIFAAITKDVTVTDEATPVTYTTAAGKPAAVTAANCIYNPHFMRWAIYTIKTVSDALPFVNKKYNDGTVSTWLNREDRVRVFNSAFINAYETYLKADVYNVDQVDIDGAYYKTPFWNVQPEALIPTIENSTSAEYQITVEEQPQNTSLDHVVGVVFDRYAAGYTETPIPVATSYNASGRFFNYFHDVDVRYFVDMRNTAVTFTLN